jgi:hypothetical protein
MKPATFLKCFALMLALPAGAFAAGNFYAWEFKPGHGGITSEKLTFASRSLTIEMWLNLEPESIVKGMNISSTMADGQTGFSISFVENPLHDHALELRVFTKTGKTPGGNDATRKNISIYFPKAAFEGQWGHLAYVVSEAGNNACGYLNGQPYADTIAPGGWTGNHPSQGLSIGAWWNDPKPVGKIAGYRIWSVARTAQQIADNYDKHLDPADNTGLQVNYRFDAFRREVENTAGNHHHGQCYPAVGWQQYHNQVTLAHAPENISIAQNQLAWSTCSAIAPDRNIAGNFIVGIEPETEKPVPNPLNGWTLYGSASPPSDFWTNCDNMPLAGSDQTVKVSDYAHVLYIRTSWTALNPAEDEYGWETNEQLQWMIDNARQRGMKLAFRVVVDSRDKSSDFTPPYVRNAGAQGYETQTGSKTVWSPYPDDPVFREKYTRFLHAFGQQFNDPDVVAFIDGYGLGKWGEGHSMRYLDAGNRRNVFDWICNLYLEQFTQVPVAINYHRLIGTEKDWGAPDPESQTMLESAFEKGFILRHDAFGMTDYYKEWEKKLAARWNYTRPILMEGGWVTSQHNISSDPRGYETIADVRQGEWDDSQEARVNMMDFRINETASWFQDAAPLLRRFIADGGYRLYPDTLSLPGTIVNGATAVIVHRWKNLGWGYCPSNIPQWNQKYKVAWRLLDQNDNAIATFVDTQTDVSKWIKDHPVTYRFTPSVAGLPAGNYTWAVAIVDTTRNNTKGINIAAKKNITASGWLRLMDVVVK